MYLTTLVDRKRFSQVYKQVYIVHFLVVDLYSLCVCDLWVTARALPWAFLSRPFRAKIGILLLTVCCPKVNRFRDQAFQLPGVCSRNRDSSDAAHRDG